MTFINYVDFSFCFFTGSARLHSCLAPGVGVELPVFLVRNSNNSPPSPHPRCPVLPQPPAWTPKLRTPGPRPHVPETNPVGRGECRTAAGQRDSEINTQRGRKNPGETHTERYQHRDSQVVETFSERHRQREGQAELHPETWRTPQGCASHAHSGAYTGPHPLRTATHSLRRGCADSLQQSQVTTSLEGRGSASAHHARKGVSCLCDGGSLWPVVANLLPPGRRADLTNHTRPDTVTAGHRSPQWRPRPE